jgi:[protein-PII] uridylyltransferase
MVIPDSITAVLERPFDKEAYLEAQQALYDWLATSFNDYPIDKLVKARKDFVDIMLNGLWQHVGLEKDRNTTLIAVGGYGRGELHPYSDVDLLILSNGELPSHTIEKIERFISTLWDLKLDIGHSVRTIDDTLAKSAEDITIATSLLEMRWLCGVKLYWNTLKKRLRAESFWSSKDFFIAKREEQYQRHHKYHGVTYTLEPNLKANPGCLRDIQTIAWIARHHLRYGKAKKSKEKQRYLTEEEFFELSEAQDALWNIRFALHLEVGRGENRLLFDHQAAVAQRLGFGDHGKASVERMMKRLYKVMQRVSELNEMLLHHYESEILGENDNPEITILDNDFQVADQLIQIRHPNIFFQRHKLLQLFVHVAQQDNIRGIHSATIRQLRQMRNRSIGELQDYVACQKRFIKIFQYPQGILRAIQLMHKHGILAIYLPLWQRIVGQMQFDLFHAYTVDEHTIKVMQNCQQFFAKDASNEFVLCNEIAKRFAKPQLLFLAAMFHDIAKGRGGSHSELGAIDAKEFSERHQLSKYDTKLLIWLVKNHLLLSTTAQRKDIYDPEVIKTFAEAVRDETTLDYLYCLTVADVRATNDNLWNSWKASLFQDLYLFCQKALRRGLEKPLDIRAVVRDRQSDAKKLLLKQGFAEQQITDLWSRLQANYFAHNSAEQIAWHGASILNQDDLNKPLVLVSETPKRGGTPIFIYYPMQQNIFVNVVSTLDDKKLNVLDAQLARNKDNYVMHTFIVLEKDGNTISSRARIDKIEQALKMALQGDRKKRFQPQRPSRKIKSFDVRPKIDFLRSSGKNTSTVEITALDVPGLLVSIARIFQRFGLVVHAARITTIGEKAEDMFVVSSSDALALTTEQQAELANILTSKLAVVST